MSIPEHSHLDNPDEERSLAVMVKVYKQKIEWTGRQSLDSNTNYAVAVAQQLGELARAALPPGTRFEIRRSPPCLLDPPETDVIHAMTWHADPDMQKYDYWPEIPIAQDGAARWDPLCDYYLVARLVA